MVTRTTKKPATREPGVSTKLPTSKRGANIRIRSFKEIYGHEPTIKELKRFVQGPVRGKEKPVIMPVI